MGLRYGCFLPVFAEEYSGFPVGGGDGFSVESGFPVGGGDGFSVEWLEGLFSCGEEYRYFIKGKRCNIAGMENQLYIKE